MRWLTVAALVTGSSLPALADDAPQFRITLHERFACVTPCDRGRARADGGSIDVRTTAPATRAVRMTGTAVATSFLACTSSTAERFQLIQHFEVDCADPSVREVVLTLDSALVGYISTARKAGACMRLADAAITPWASNSNLLGLSHPPMCGTGGQARQCNQHLATLQGPPTPLGRYTLVANFLLDATAGGVCNARAVADFSPDTKLPSEWVATRDPFQGANKDGFGYFLTLSAQAPPPPPPQPVNAPSDASPSLTPPPRPPAVLPPPLGANSDEPHALRDFRGRSAVRPGAPEPTRRRDPGRTALAE